jgi:hypothetical protein
MTRDGGVQQNSRTAELVFPDGTRLTVVLQSGSVFPAKFVEVIGMMMPDGTLQEHTFTSMGETFGAVCV